MDGADRSGKSGQHRLAAGQRSGGGLVERSEGRDRAEPEPNRGEQEAGGDKGADGEEGSEGSAGADGLVSTEWNAVCAVMGYSGHLGLPMEPILRQQGDCPGPPTGVKGILNGGYGWLVI